MLDIRLSSEEISTLNRERFYHPHPQVRRRMTVVWMLSQGYRQRDCAQIAGISERTVRRYIEGYEKNGLNWLRQIRCKGRPSRLRPHAITLEAEFKSNPPTTVASATERVKDLCGVEIRPTQMRAFLHSQDFKWRKIAAIIWLVCRPCSAYRKIPNGCFFLSKLFRLYFLYFCHCICLLFDTNR